MPSSACNSPPRTLRATLSLHDALPISPGRLVVEQDAADGVQAVGLAVVDGDPVAVDLGDTIGRARVEGRRLALRSLLRLAEHLGRARDRKSTRLNSSHSQISYAVFCL